MRIIEIREVVSGGLPNHELVVRRRFTRRATLTYLGGGERLDQSVVVSEQKARFMVRQGGIKDINTSWTVVSKRGSEEIEWKIVAITEPPDKQGVFFILHCEVVE